jgi:hypothetical protein
MKVFSALWMSLVVCVDGLVEFEGRIVNFSAPGLGQVVNAAEFTTAKDLAAKSAVIFCFANNIHVKA